MLHKELRKIKLNSRYDTDCEKMHKKEYQIYKIMTDKQYTRYWVEKYSDLREEEKKMHRKKKMAYVEEKYKEIKNLKMQKEAYKLYHNWLMLLENISILEQLLSEREMMN